MYQLMIVDFCMDPGLTGPETTKRIRNLLQEAKNEQSNSQSYDPYIVCLSAADEEEFRIAAENAGMNQYCSQKPMQNQELEELLITAKIL